MRPVSAQFSVSQEFGGDATQGVAGDPNGSEVQQLVAAYGNYQPYGHAGQDIACPVGTPVHAIAAGTVLWADWGTNLPGDDSWGPSGYFRRWALYKTFPGIVTVIQHNGWKSVYAHLSNAPLNPGDVVTEGQQIALSGNTRAPGVSLGAHLHVEALVDDSYSTGNGLIYGRTNPEPFFGSAAIGPQGAITKEDELSAADVQEIKEYVHALIVGGYNSAGQNRPGIADLITETHTRATRYLDAPVGAVPSKTSAAVWSTTVNRGGGKISALQELADAKTAALTIQARPVPAAPTVDVQALAAEVATHLTTAQAHQFIVALGQALPKE